MKVGVYLVDNITPSAGGNFSYYDKLIRAIDARRFDDRLSVCFVGRLPSSEIMLDKPYVRLSSPIYFKLSRFLGKLGLTRLLSAMFSRNVDFSNSRDRAILRKNGVDILLFPKQFFREITDFPFMTMNWDAGHKSTFAFPEFMDGFEIRAHWYAIDMQKALAIIVESEGSKTEFTRFFAIPEAKVEIVPLFAGGVVDMKVDETVQRSILGKLNLTKGAYYYYPAQYWAHKNHFNLIMAFKKLTGLYPERPLKLVFSGSDKGNKEYISSVIRSEGLDNRIDLLGFVSEEEVYTLYRNSIALVMPTFLGPTNMPLLEAQALETPVICSDLPGHREMCGKGALYASPQDTEQWAQAMAKVLDGNNRAELIAAANEVAGASRFNIRHAMDALEKILLKFIPVRKTFS